MKNLSEKSHQVFPHEASRCSNDLKDRISRFVVCLFFAARALEGPAACGWTLARRHLLLNNICSCDSFPQHARRQATSPKGGLLCSPLSIPSLCAEVCRSNAEGVKPSLGLCCQWVTVSCPNTISANVKKKTWGGCVEHRKCKEILFVLHLDFKKSGQTWSLCKGKVVNFGSDGAIHVVFGAHRKRGKPKPWGDVQKMLDGDLAFRAMNYLTCSGRRNRR